MILDGSTWADEKWMPLCNTLHLYAIAGNGWSSPVIPLVNDWSQICLNFSTLTITRHPLSLLQSSQSLLKDSARQSMSATLTYACSREGCVVMTPARLYQLLAKEWVTGWVTPKTGPTLPHGKGSPWQTDHHRSVSTELCPLTQVCFADSIL